MYDPPSMGLGCCLSGATVIAMADGTGRPLRALADDGADVNVLAVDVNGVVVVRRMRHPRRTEIDADVYVTTLESGDTFVGTAGHLVLLADHSDCQIGMLERGVSRLWYARREGETIIRGAGERYRAYALATADQDQPGRPVSVVCENCGCELLLAYAKRAQRFCSPQCETTHKSKLLHARRESAEEYDSVLVRSVRRHAREDVYNAVVDEFHNVCIVSSSGKGAADTLICVSTF